MELYAVIVGLVLFGSGILAEFVYHCGSSRSPRSKRIETYRSPSALKRIATAISRPAQAQNPRADCMRETARLRDVKMVPVTQEEPHSPTVPPAVQSPVCVSAPRHKDRASGKPRRMLRLVNPALVSRSAPARQSVTRPPLLQCGLHRTPLGSALISIVLLSAGFFITIWGAFETRAAWEVGEASGAVAKPVTGAIDAVEATVGAEAQASAQMHLPRVAHSVAGRVPLIIDTDMSFDVDDVGAICIAHALMDRGEADLLAVVHSSGYPEGIGAASVLNEWYGHTSVLLGAYQGSFGVDGGGKWISGLYVPDLVSRFPSVVKNRSQVPSSVQVYRQALASADNASVAIAVIGFATNIALLLRSTPDEYSQLSGVELVAQKVKLIVWQGGWYPPLHPNAHTTFNWDCGGCCGYDVSACLGEASYAVANIPPSVEQIFSDLGDEIYHGGGRFRRCTPPENPCRQAYIDHVWGQDDQTEVGTELVQRHGSPVGRQSWDPLAVLVAVRGADAGKCYKDQPGGSNRVDYKGANFWTPPDGLSPNTMQSILALQGEEPWRETRLAASEALDDLLCQPPWVTR